MKKHYTTKKTYLRMYIKIEQGGTVIANGEISVDQLRDVFIDWNPTDVEFDGDIDYAYVAVINKQLVSITFANTRIDLGRVLNAPHETFVFKNCTCVDTPLTIENKNLVFENCVLSENPTFGTNPSVTFMGDVSQLLKYKGTYSRIVVYTDDDLSVLREIKTKWLHVHSNNWIGLGAVVDLPNIETVSCTLEGVDQTQATTIARELKGRGANVVYLGDYQLRGRTREIIDKSIIESNVKTSDPEVLRKRELYKDQLRILGMYGFRRADPTKPAPIGEFNDKTGDNAPQSRILRMLIGRVRKR